MHWITILGIVLIAAGTILACFGQNIRSRFDKHLHQSVSEKTFQIDGLKRGNDELLVRIDEYQKSMSEKDETIQWLEAQVGESNVSAPEQPVDKQVEVPVDESNIPVREQSADKQIEVGTQIIPEKQLSNEIAQAKSLYNEGKYDEAYRIADELRQKNPDFGLAYFILGTTEMHRKYYDDGEELLNRAVQLGLPDEDMAWAFHNLGISSLRRQDFESAKEFLGKSIELNSDMEKSRKALKLINNYLKREHEISQVKSLYNEGNYDDAYRIADELRRKHPDFGLAYFILGTIEMHKEHYDKGEGLLNRAVQLELPDDDMAWAFHNLGIFSLRKKDFMRARELLVKSIEFNPNMEESKKILKSLDDLPKKE